MVNGAVTLTNGSDNSHRLMVIGFISYFFLSDALESSPVISYF